MRKFYALFPGIALGMLICIFVAGLPSNSMSQTTVISGTTLTVTAGSTLVSNGEFIINSGATVDVQASGSLVLKNDLTNNNAGVNDLGDGTVTFSGSSAQDIAGQNAMGGMTVNNSSGITLSGNTRINGALQLSNGVILIGNFNLLLGASAVISGTPGTTKMVVTNGTGQMRKEYQSGYSGTFTFPIGDNTSGNEYSPVQLDFNSGTFSSGNYAGVRVVDGTYPGLDEDNYLTRYWDVTSSNISSFNCDAIFNYLSGDVVGTEDDIVCAKVNTTPWVAYNMANSASNQISADGLTGFSSFTGVDGKVTPPENRTLSNLTIPNGTTTCYSAQQILTVAGSGNTFLVQSGGSVTLVAGSKILLLEGTTIQSGGYLWAYITTDNTYCSPVTPTPSLVNTITSDDQFVIFGNTSDRFIKLYPNPTRDDVTLEVSNLNAETSIQYEIYGMRGEKIMQEKLQGIEAHKISLSGYPVGIYVIHVIAGDKSETAKIIKTN